MRLFKAVLFVLVILPVFACAVNEENDSFVKSDENYFKTWLQFRENRKFYDIKKLLGRLTEEELVVAVEQTCDWIDEQKQQSPNGDYDEIAILAVRDFVYEYFKGNPDISPEPFLEMLENSALDSQFRLMLIQYLGNVYDEERLHYQSVCDSLIEIIRDTNEPLELCRIASNTMSRLLGHQRHRVYMSQNELNGLSAEELLIFPKEQLSAGTEKRIRVLAENYNRYAWAVLSLTARNLTLYERLIYTGQLSEQKKRGFVTDPALIEALDSALNELALSKDELIEGAKQVNEMIAEKKNLNEQPPEYGWKVNAGIMACAFVEYYFRTFPEETPGPFLEMAVNKSNDEDFRAAMLTVLGDDDFYRLKQGDIDLFSSSLMDIAEDKENPARIRKAAIDCLQEQLVPLEAEGKENEQWQKINVIRDKAVQLSSGLAK